MTDAPASEKHVHEAALRVLRCPVRRAETAGGWTLLWLEAPEVAAYAAPGQFVMTAVPGGGFHLRRPLSVHRVEDDQVALLVEARGEGTHALASLRAGDIVALSGPLGRGFPLVESGSAVLVGGGIGLAPLAFLADELSRRGVEALAYAGVRSGADVPGVALAGVPGVVVATEDGSVGTAGTVVDLLDRTAEAAAAAGAGAPLYVCGPLPMIAAVERWARGRGASGFASLEAHMACGTGACHGCVVPTASGPQRVCREGPVFPLDQVMTP